MNDEMFQAFQKLANTKMPYGKYKGVYLSDIPEAYLIWYQRKGFPQGLLGKQMAEVLELKINGLEGLLKNLRKKS